MHCGDLYEALDRLPLTHEDWVICIDAIAINQFNLPERNSQVQLMRSIYSRAQETLIWAARADATLQCWPLELPLRERNENTEKCRGWFYAHGIGQSNVLAEGLDSGPLKKSDIRGKPLC